MFWKMNMIVTRSMMACTMAQNKAPREYSRFCTPSALAKWSPGLLLSLKTR